MIACYCFAFNYVQQKRFQNDMVINNTPMDVLQGEQWVAIPWKKLQVGDIVRVSVLEVSLFLS